MALTMLVAVAVMGLARAPVLRSCIDHTYSAILEVVFARLCLEEHNAREGASD